LEATVEPAAVHAPSSPRLEPEATQTAPSLPAGSRRRLWLLLTLAALLAACLTIPYLLPIISAGLEKARAAGKPVPPLAVGVLAQVLQITVFASIAAWLGVLAAPLTGLDAPFLRALAARRSPGRSLLAEVPRALALGTAFSLGVLGLNYLASPWLAEVLRLHAQPAMAVGDRLLATAVGASSAFYGGIIEELLLRWGLLALIAAGLAKAGLRDTAGFWLANVLSALLFGAGHLPAAQAVASPLGTGATLYIIAANSLAGLVCGWLFKRRGLEAAMMAHAWGDVCLHALPLWL
jgi:hypothetical protein